MAGLQEELGSRVQAWEQEHEGMFLVKGQQLMAYVSEQWQLYHLEKEKEKQERQLKKRRQIEAEMLYGSTPRTPIKRRMLGTTTPGKARKCHSQQHRSFCFGETIYHSPVTRLPPSGVKNQNWASHPGGLLKLETPLAPQSDRQ
ncbi:protein regulator of cytokinesis 1-like [Cuculus canorus]|uniref:protein regulator of cytokinesis 1-like n=1 Tax=Cuculus canorus TaxID=55661 RepID=UPI0023AB2D51|nr:protein regulator of cytokinesis 1-like [Cuculus canorus]